MVQIEVGSPKMARETLCRLQSLVSVESHDDNKRRDIGQLQGMIDQLDAHRPLGVDGKHGDLHTATCGCEGYEGLTEAPVVALTPLTGTMLYHAWYCEEARKRHEAEFWIGQAGRDIANREMWRERAVANGVPRHQADAYIYSGPMTDSV
jgi:hypothetical protein